MAFYEAFGAVSVFTQLTHLPREAKVLLMIAVDLLVLPAAMFAACLLVNGRPGGPAVPVVFYPLVALIGPMVFGYFGLYRAVTRFIGLDAIKLIVRSVSVVAVLVVVAAVLMGQRNIAPEVFIVFWGASVLVVGGLRLTARAIVSGTRPHKASDDRVVVYGAGDAGRQLMSALERSARYTPVCFVDDDPQMVDRNLAGYPVRNPGQLGELVPQHRVSHVLLAIPSLDRERRRAIISRLEPLPVRVMTMPGMADLVSGESVLTSLRDVEVEDLLNREPVLPDEHLIERTVRERTVLVTGAGGSIGSELARQVLRRQPHRLVVLDVSEFSLYAINRELESIALAENLDVQIVPLLGSVLDGKRMTSLMGEYAVQTVYHAAAYKHVPLVEANPLAGARNNVLGTYETLRAALRNNVERFVLISTDKAVRPTNVMGATKRLAELVLQAYAREKPSCQLCMVRFGNVLASSGSVVPLFREQIRKGGPVTVTHPEVNRYFMTIPEATQLVMQAGAMGGNGEVFVLDMGEPVRIFDLATRMIQLYGYSVKSDGNPHGDIEVRVTGLRPGEKLYEELLIDAQDAPTAHPRIRVASEDSLSLADMQVHLKGLSIALDAQDTAQIRAILERTVSGYLPSAAFRKQSDRFVPATPHPNVSTLPRPVLSDALFDDAQGPQGSTRHASAADDEQPDGGVAG